MRVQFEIQLQVLVDVLEAETWRELSLKLRLLLQALQLFQLEGQLPAA